MTSKPLQQKVPQLARMITELYQKMITQQEYIVSKQLFRSGISIGANEAEAHKLFALMSQKKLSLHRIFPTCCIQL